MKKAILFFLLAGTFGAKAQSLKDLLYSGKLKTDSSSVIRKSDDLSAKIDTTTRKKEAEPVKTKTITVIDSSGNKVIKAEETAAEAKENTTGAKNNTTVWKSFMDSVLSIIKTDVLPSKKIKNDTYYLYVDYEIGVDGQVNIANVVSSPENSFLQDQVKSILISGVPQLSPALDSNNKPRKVKRKYNFNFTKN